jgi:ubiquitin C-terminal hydrolase
MLSNSNDIPNINQENNKDLIETIDHININTTKDEITDNIEKNSKESHLNNNNNEEKSKFKEDIEGNKEGEKQIENNNIHAKENNSNDKNDQELGKKIFENKGSNNDKELELGKKDNSESNTNAKMENSEIEEIDNNNAEPENKDNKASLEDEIIHNINRKNEEKEIMNNNKETQEDFIINEKNEEDNKNNNIRINDGKEENINNNIKEEKQIDKNEDKNPKEKKEVEKNMIIEKVDNNLDDKEKIQINIIDIEVDKRENNDQENTKNINKESVLNFNQKNNKDNNQEDNINNKKEEQNINQYTLKENEKSNIIKRQENDKNIEKDNQIENNINPKNNFKENNKNDIKADENIIEEINQNIIISKTLNEINNNQENKDYSNQDKINKINLEKKDNKKNNIISSKNSNDEEEEEEENENNINFYDDFKNHSGICGIKNLGNNCYLNSGLQILASCEELINFLNKDEYKNVGRIIIEFKNAMNSLLNDSIYNPKKFIDCFCKINKDFIKGRQNCSQNFIRTIIRNINKEFIDNNYGLISKNKQYPKRNNKEYKEYEKFINKIYPESNAISIFSGISKSHSKGKCPKCKAKIDNYSFSYFIDQNMYLDEFDSDCDFSDVLEANIGNFNTLTMDCENCNEEIDIKEETKIIKLPDILIFTLERYQGPTNNVKIKPDEILNMKDYIDSSLDIENTEYELFAINIRFGKTANFGHEICQVKRNGKWYEINDRYGEEIKNISHFDSSYGLFYRKIKIETYQNIYIDDDEEIIKINNIYSNVIKLNEKKILKIKDFALDFLLICFLRKMKMPKYVKLKI